MLVPRLYPYRYTHLDKRLDLQDSRSHALHGKSSILLTSTRIQPMSETNVGANLMFALRTKTINEPMSETHTFISEHIGLIPVIV